MLFGFNSSALTPAAPAAVTALAGQLRSAGSTGTIQISGQASPIAPNTSYANRSRNRRVTIVVPTPKP